MNLYNIKHPEEQVNFAQAVRQGLGKDQGLFFPETIPALTNIGELLALPLVERSQKILGALIGEELPKATLDAMVKNAFTFPAPLEKVEDNIYALELFHGPTLAFKDFGGRFMAQALAAVRGDGKITILTATSGDTGAAVAHAFYGLENINVVILYPKGKISPLQEKLFCTLGGNIRTVAINGDFDACQALVKQAFDDAELRQAIGLNSANSINISRLLAQVCYYFEAVAQLPKEKRDNVVVSVPSGNFGNILAAFYAKGIGVPINKLICASNENDVLVDFFQTGTYNRLREFKLTSSPSMDILVSSNLERFVFELTGRSSQETNALMTSLKENGSYSVPNTDTDLFQQFYGNRASQEETAQTIHDVFKSEHYLLDPHTAVADAVYTKYKKETGDETPTVVVSTASPYKFPQSVLSALDVDTNQSDAELMDAIQQESVIAIPTAVTSVLDAPIRHTKVLSIEGMKQSVLDSLNIQ